MVRATPQEYFGAKQEQVQPQYYPVPQTYQTNGVPEQPINNQNFIIIMGLFAVAIVAITAMYLRSK